MKDNVTVEDETWVPYALIAIGEFNTAQPWFERAVAETEKGDTHGRIDHASLGMSVHQVGYCFSKVGKFEAAMPWFERAVAEAEKGDTHGHMITTVLARACIR